MKRRFHNVRRPAHSCMRYSIELTRFEAIPTAVIRSKVPHQELSRFVPAACGEVWSFIRAAGLPKPGRHVALYLDRQGSSARRWRSRLPGMTAYTAPSFQPAGWRRRFTTVPTPAWARRMRRSVNGAPLTGSGSTQFAGRCTATGTRAGTAILPKFARMFITCCQISRTFHQVPSHDFYSMNEIPITVIELDLERTDYQAAALHLLNSTSCACG